MSRTRHAVWIDHFGIPTRARQGRSLPSCSCPRRRLTLPACLRLETVPHRRPTRPRRLRSSRSSAARPAGRHDAVDNVTRVYTELRSLIISGQLPPGARIAERAVVARMGLSRTPVRSALHRLQQEGLVASVGRAGDQRLIVTPLTRGDGREVFLDRRASRGTGGERGGVAAGRRAAKARRRPARGQPRARRRREDQGVTGAAVRPRPAIPSPRTSRASPDRASSRCIAPSSRRASATRACT